MKVREDVFRVITDCFKLHGAETIDTPVIELTVNQEIEIFDKDLQNIPNFCGFCFQDNSH